PAVPAPRLKNSTRAPSARLELQSLVLRRPAVKRAPVNPLSALRHRCDSHMATPASTTRTTIQIHAGTPLLGSAAGCGAAAGADAASTGAASAIGASGAGAAAAGAAAAACSPT